MTKPPPPVFLPGKSMDRGAWWATVYGVVKSQTWMSNWVQWYGMNQRLWLIQFCTLETQKKKKKEVNKDTACAGCLEAAIWGPQTSQWKPWRAGKVTRCNDSSQRLPRKERKGRLPKHGPQTIKLQLFNIFFALLYYYHVIYWKRRKKNTVSFLHTWVWGLLKIPTSSTCVLHIEMLREYFPIDWFWSTGSWAWHSSIE